MPGHAVENVASGALQALRALDTPGRPLTEGERTFLAEVWPPGTLPDLARVRVHDGGLVKEILDSGATTLGYAIYFKRERYEADLAGNALLAHEVCHVWQHERRAYTGYSLPKVLEEHVAEDDPYAFELPESPDADFFAYGFEQQCALVQRSVAAREAEEPPPLLRVVRRGLTLEGREPAHAPDLAADYAALATAVGDAEAEGEALTEDAVGPDAEATRRRASRAEDVRLFVTAWRARQSAGATRENP